MAAIVWTEPAREHFDEIIRDIALDSPEFARAVANNVSSRIERLRDFPDSGRWVPDDRTKTYREVIAGNYRVIYVSLPGTVAIIAVIHGARAFKLG